MKTFDEWKAFFEKKTGDTYCEPEGYETFFLPERGYIQMKVDGDMLLIYGLTGDGRYWRDFAETIARSLGMKCMASICTRKVLPYIRFWGWSVEYEDEQDGTCRYYCRDKQGRQVILTPKHYDDNGELCYWVTQYLVSDDELRR